MAGAWIAYLLALAVALGFLHPVGPLPTPPSKAPAASMCDAAKADAQAGGHLDPAAFCK